MESSVSIRAAGEGGDVEPVAIAPFVVGFNPRRR